MIWIDVEAYLAGSSNYVNAVCQTMTYGSTISFISMH